MSYRTLLPLLCCSLIAVQPALAEGPARVQIILRETEVQAVERSNRYQAARFDQQAAEARAAAQSAHLYPRLTFEGTYRYLTVVPELTFGGPFPDVRKFGDNTNYSVGPQVTWTLYDGGSLRYAAASADAASQAKRYDTDNVRRQLLLSSRGAYFQVAVSAEQVALLADSLKLSQRQYADITARARAGASSRLDQLSSHQDVLARQRQLSQARADLSQSLRDLSSLTGESYLAGPSLPLDAVSAGAPPEGIVPANTVVEVEKIDDLLARFKGYASAKFSGDLPVLRSLDKTVRSARLAASSASGGLYPKVSVLAKTSIDYPNGPTLESINQNMLGANLSWPLFEAGLTRSRAAENTGLAEAAGKRKDMAAVDLARDWHKASDRQLALQEQLDLSIQAAREADEIARLAYASYRNGALTYTEVQNANFRALEAKINLSRIKVQMLQNLAVLASLTE